MTVNTAPGECSTFLTNKITSWETSDMSLTCFFSFIAAYYSCTSPATPALMLWVSECLVRHTNVFFVVVLKPFALSSKDVIHSNLLFVLPGDHPRHFDQSFPFPCGDSSDVILLRKLLDPVTRNLDIPIEPLITKTIIHIHFTSWSRWFTIKLVSGMKGTSRRAFSPLKEMVVQGGDSKLCFLQLGIWCWSSYSAGHQVHAHILP